MTSLTHSLKHTLIFIMASGHHTVYHLPEPGPTSCREDVSVGSQTKRRSTSGRTARPSPSPTGSRPIRHVQRQFGLVSRNSNSVNKTSGIFKSSSGRLPVVCLQFRSRCHWPHLVINRHAVRPRHVDETASTSCAYQTGLIRQHRRQDRRHGRLEDRYPTENYVQHPHEVEPTPRRRVRPFRLLYLPSDVSMLPPDV